VRGRRRVGRRRTARGGGGGPAQAARKGCSRTWQHGRASRLCCRPPPLRSPVLHARPRPPHPPTSPAPAPAATIRCCNATRGAPPRCASAWRPATSAPARWTLRRRRTRGGGDGDLGSSASGGLMGWQGKQHKVRPAACRRSRDAAPAARLTPSAPAHAPTYAPALAPCRVLELDPSNADALLGLATLHLNSASVQQVRARAGGRGAAAAGGRAGGARRRRAGARSRQQAAWGVPLAWHSAPGAVC
jgi:hypothetical protein